MSLTKPVFSVSEFNEMVNQHLSLLGEVMVEGEISEINVNSRPWVYMTIKDETAVLKLFAVSYQLSNLSAVEVGMKVKVRGAPSLYARYGKFSLRINQIIPSGEGALKLAYEKLKKQLEKEGLFDESKKRKLPMFPQTIGLITAKDSEAFKDFVKIINETTGGLKIFFYPVNVQGENAVKSVNQALTYFNVHQQTDVLVITRGGGSLEDLAAFNDESIVRTINSSKIPTICAIGHEGNLSLAELTADLRASTPSNAAQLLVRNSLEVVREINDQADKIETQIIQSINLKHLKIKHSITVLGNYIDRSLNQIESMLSSFKYYLNQTETDIKNLFIQIKTHRQDLVKNFSFLTSQYQDGVGHLKDKLKSLDYKSVLKRGFSIVKNQSNQVIKSISQVKIADQLEILLSDGNVDTKVLSKIKREL